MWFLVISLAIVCFPAIHAEIRLPRSVCNYESSFAEDSNASEHEHYSADCELNSDSDGYGLPYGEEGIEFFAWNLDEESLINALFPDLARLQDAWEVHPLLSKVSFTQTRHKVPLGSIPTIFHNRSVLLNLDGTNSDANDAISSLFSVTDIS